MNDVTGTYVTEQNDVNHDTGRNIATNENEEDKNERSGGFLLVF